MNNASGQPGAGWRGSDSEREGAREAEGVYEAFAHAHDSIKRYIDKATESGCSWKQLGALVVELILVPTLILPAESDPQLISGPESHVAEWYFVRIKTPRFAFTSTQSQCFHPERNTKKNLVE